ncbi:MAG: thioredoxin family protein [Candidatus Dependentiae bacterium]|nr:thioredoxin family protein [Candidatus Dependentiae bacterium]
MFTKKQFSIALGLLCVVPFASYAFWGNAEDVNAPSVEITQDAFEKEVLFSDLPVILDVYAEWCFPCQILKPMFAQVAHDFKDSCKLVSIDYHKNLELTSTLAIRCFPTMLVYRKGKIVQRFEGFPGSKQDLEKFVQEVVGRGTGSAAQN